MENLELLEKELKEKSVLVMDEILYYDYRKFVHILDPAGNKIKLWEPIDKVFDSYVSGRTK